MAMDLIDGEQHEHEHREPISEIDSLRLVAKCDALGSLFTSEAKGEYS
uniref:Transposase n=1 Tax=Syphacia muris TaxID=451379 RepID=A0A0N5AKT1_9BILA